MRFQQILPQLAQIFYSATCSTGVLVLIYDGQDETAKSMHKNLWAWEVVLSSCNPHRTLVQLNIHLGEHNGFSEANQPSAACGIRLNVTVEWQLIQVHNTLSKPNTPDLPWWSCYEMVIARGYNRMMIYFTQCHKTSRCPTCYSQIGLQWDRRAAEALSHTPVAAGVALLYVTDEERAIVEQEHAVKTAEF